jgi:hypothetical protein
VAVTRVYSWKLSKALTLKSEFYIFDNTNIIGYKNEYLQHYSVRVKKTKTLKYWSINVSVKTKAFKC